MLHASELILTVVCKEYAKKLDSIVQNLVAWDFYTPD